MKKSDLRAFLNGKIPFTIWLQIQGVLIKKYLIRAFRGAFRGLENREGLSEWNIQKIAKQGRKPGISGFARLRDSSLYLEKVVEAHLPYLDEIILVDNNSQDNTWKICQSLKEKHPDKIRIFRYLPEVYRLGTAEYQTCPEDSVHDMSYYYNWTLSQTSYQYAMKIDDDHLPLPEEFEQIRTEILQGKYENSFLALGLYNIEQGKTGLELDLEHPLAGIYGDFGIFPVSENTYFVKDKRCENFIHRLKWKRGGLALFHLKFWQKGFGARNYRGKLESEHKKIGSETVVLNKKLNQIFETFKIKNNGDEERKKERAPLVSIITPCYKGGTYLPLSIKSVLDQDFENFELILIDDKSPDNTWDIMQKEWEKSDFDPRLILLQNDRNLGIVGTRNRALELAKGKYICFLDQDDLWIAKDKLSLQVAFLEKNPDCVMIGSHTDLIDRDGKKIGQIHFATSDEEIRSKLLFRNQFCTCAVMIRHETIRKSGLLDKKYDKVDDFDLWLRAGKYGKFANLDKNLVAYRKSGNNTSANNQTYLHMKRLHLKLVWREFWNYPRASFALVFSMINSLIPYTLAEKIKKLLFN